MAVTSLLFFSFCLSAYTFVYLGRNTYDQVILGLVSGIFLAFFFHYTLKLKFKYLQVYLADPFISRNLSTLLS